MHAMERSVSDPARQTTLDVTQVVTLRRHSLNTGKSPNSSLPPVRRYPSAAKDKRPTGGVFMLTPFMTSSPVTGGKSNLGMDGCHLSGSQSSLDESGISSKGSSCLEDSNTLQSLSAPSSPIMARRKPPPKPPRLQHSFLASPGSRRAGKAHCQRTPSVRSAGVASLKSLLATDVTTVLDASVAGPLIDQTDSVDGVDGVQNDKIQRIMIHVKKFLSHEIDAGPLLSFLRGKNTISVDEESNIRACANDHERCELLLDMITSKGQSEFQALCDALRNISEQHYLSDLLYVLDTLAKAFMNITDVGKQKAACGACMFNNNVEEDGEEVVDGLDSFDVDISYIDTETGQSRTLDDVIALSQKREKLQTECGDCDLLPQSSQTGRCLPVIAISLYNQCLRCNRRIDTLVDLLRSYTCIAELSIVKSHIGEKDLDGLSEALHHNSGLSKLDVRLNTIGNDGTARLVESVCKNSSMRRLNVTGTGLSGPTYSRLLVGVARSQSLTELNISFNELPNTGCRVIAEYLTGNAPLRRLRMRHNNVSADGACSIFVALRRNSRLTSLDISCNTLGDYSMTVLSEVLLCNRTLRELNLESCSITRVGCAALGRALKTNTMLRALDLSMNPLGDGGAEAVADGLRYNQTLRVLALNMCDIGNSGFLTLLSALRHNASMETLKLCYNRVGHIDKNGIEWHRLQHDDHMLPSIEVLYANLCRTLQLNKDLKVLLWGNQLEQIAEEASTSGESTPSLDTRPAQTDDNLIECGNAI